METPLTPNDLAVSVVTSTISEPVEAPATVTTLVSPVSTQLMARNAVIQPVSASLPAPNALAKASIPDKQ